MSENETAFLLPMTYALSRFGSFLRPTKNGKCPSALEAKLAFNLWELGVELSQ